MAKKQQQKPYWEMTAAELGDATKEFDREIPPSRLKPLSKRGRTLWEKAKAGPHVSIRLYNGQSDVAVSLDDDLLKQVRAYAKKHKTSLPKMIDRGLRELLALEK